MRRFMTAAVFSIAAFPSLALAAETDPHDYNLVVYPILPAQEVQFQGQSGNIAGFWSDWAGRDYIDMTTTQNSWLPGTDRWTGSDDAELLVRAAWGVKGLYLLYEIIDNGRLMEEIGDYIDIFLDKLSAEEIMAANPYDLYIRPIWGWTLTRNSIQFEINIRSGLADYLYINYFSDTAMTYHKVTLPQLITDYNGLDMNLKAVSGTRNLFEMFIPWTWVGCNGGLGGAPSVGARIAMSGGYTDADPGMAMGGRKCLRWKQKDPFNTCNDQDPPRTFCDAWGDLEIAGSTAIEPSRHSRMPGIAPTKIAYFTLRGETIPVSRIGMMAPGTLVVKTGSISGGVSKPYFIGRR